MVLCGLFLLLGCSEDSPTDPGGGGGGYTLEKTETFGPGGGSIEIEDLTLTVPAGLSMEFDIKLTYTRGARDDYKIMSDFPINIKESDSWNRSQKYISGTGKVADGKNKIKIETINGNIYIKKG